MASIKEEIAKNLLYYRKKAGMTQKEIADRLGVKNSAVSNWEKCNNSIDIDTLFKFCNLFEITLNDMYGKYATIPAPTITPDEAELLEAYHNAPDPIRIAVDGLLEPYKQKNATAEDVAV